VSSLAVFDTVEFYRQDIEILRDLGHDVAIAHRWHEIPWDCDLYYAWWWTWAFQPLAVARARRCPIVLTGVLDYPYQVPGRGFAARPAWQRSLMRAAMRAADANVFLSRHEAEGVPRDMPARNPRFIPLAVDTVAYSPGRAPREDFVFSVIWMDDFNVWRKCAVEIVESIPAVLSRHPAARFVIAGEHREGFERVLAAARRLGVERYVDFPGVISRGEKIRLMRTCRIYLQPTRYEGFGAAILEAMSCGAPVITNAAGAVSEVTGDCAVLLSDTHPATIAGAIGGLWDDEKLRSDLGRRGRARAQDEFSMERRRARIGRLLDEVKSRN
jgi:glycosyltransferase involved in cell wall biosynthesis